jgi:short-subunit dehydrogenase
MSRQLLVLITGANQGIGYYTAQHLASTGQYHVILGARSLLKAKNAAKQLAETKSIPSSLLEPIELDLSSDSSISAAEKHVKSKHGYLDILINNAGISGSQFKGTENLRHEC